jgi:ABC-type antimicrobial peptide transport system permease subunit
MLGILAALFRNSFFDRFANASALTSISFPEFFVAYILIFFLAGAGGAFPSMANFRSDPTFSEFLYRAFLPALTLTLVVTAHMMRMTRAAIINLLASPYIEMARLKGMSPMRIIVKHALPNALAPIINVIALNLAYLITGVVVVEVVFVYPGLGQLMIDACRPATCRWCRASRWSSRGLTCFSISRRTCWRPCPTRASCIGAEGGGSWVFSPASSGSLSSSSPQWLPAGSFAPPPSPSAPMGLRRNSAPCRLRRASGC